MMPVDEKQIYRFLKAVDEDFPVHLSDKVDIKEYAGKLFAKATLCYELDGTEISAMLAGYTENIVDNMAYIALLAVGRDYRGQGAAGRLLRQFCAVCKEKNIPAVHFYTDVRNVKAIAIYEALGFERYECENETRPKDVHFIRYL